MSVALIFDRKNPDALLAADIVSYSIGPGVFALDGYEIPKNHCGSVVVIGRISAAWLRKTNKNWPTAVVATYQPDIKPGVVWVSGPTLALAAKNLIRPFDDIIF